MLYKICNLYIILWCKKKRNTVWAKYTQWLPVITKRNLNEKSALVFGCQIVMSRNCSKWCRWGEIGKTNCVFMLNVTSFICKCHWSEAKKIRSYFRIPELSELWYQLVIFSGIEIMVACWPHPTDGIAIDKPDFVFTSNVLSVIRIHNWWVTKNTKSCFHIPELSPSPHNRRLGDKLAGKVWKTRNRQACVFFRFAVLIVGRGCQGWTPCLFFCQTSS